MSERRCRDCGTVLTFHTYNEADQELIGVAVSWVDAQTRRTGDDGHRHVPRIDWRAVHEAEQSKQDFLAMVERNRRASIPHWIYR